jgi:hypothetical protein
MMERYIREAPVGVCFHVHESPRAALGGYDERIVGIFFGQT